LAEAAEVCCGVAVLDEAEIGFDLLPLLSRELAKTVARLCGASALSVRIDAGIESVDQNRLGADGIRRIVRIDGLPDFGPRPPRYSCRPIESLARTSFIEFFEELFAPRDLGLASRTALIQTAGELQLGRPVQGRGDYLGRVVAAGSEPVGLFFLAGGGPVRELGFLGAAPGLRRRFGLRGALATGVDWMRGVGISGLTAEIAVQNPTSLAMARRLGARSMGFRVVYLAEAVRSR
jgi:hypothetical protein